MNKESVFYGVLCVVVAIGMIAFAKWLEYMVDRRNGNLVKKQAYKTRYIVFCAMLSAVATVLMLFSVPFIVPFYQVDVSELPVIIGAFAFGPVAGVVIEFLKVLLNLATEGSTTISVGEFANFLVGCCFVVPASTVYYFKKSKKNAVWGLGLGLVVCTVCGCMLNAFLLIPTYSKALGMDIETLLGKELPVFIFTVTAPLNIVKCGVTSILTMLLYKPISRILKGV